MTSVIFPAKNFFYYGWFLWIRRSVLFTTISSAQRKPYKRTASRAVRHEVVIVKSGKKIQWIWCSFSERLQSNSTARLHGKNVRLKYRLARALGDVTWSGWAS